MLANTNVIDQAVIRQSLDTGGAHTPESDAEPSLKKLELDYLQQLMRDHKGDREIVAGIAGISVRSLYRKLQQRDEENAGYR